MSRATPIYHIGGAKGPGGKPVVCYMQLVPGCEEAVEGAAAETERVRAFFQARVDSHTLSPEGPAVLISCRREAPPPKARQLYLLGLTKEEGEALKIEVTREDFVGRTYSAFSVYEATAPFGRLLRVPILQGIERLGEEPLRAGGSAEFFRATCTLGPAELPVRQTDVMARVAEFFEARKTEKRSLDTPPFVMVVVFPLAPGHEELVLTNLESPEEWRRIAEKHGGLAGPLVAGLL